MNNLYSEVLSSVGFTRGLSLQPEIFPHSYETIIIKPNDVITDNNFNFSLSCLYENFLSIVSDSYIYNSKVPVTNPRLSNTNNIVGTLCGTFIPSYTSNSGLDLFNYYVNGIPHSGSVAKNVITVHDFTVKNSYLTIAVGLLSATTLSNNLSANTYDSVLGIFNYSLSSIYNSGYETNSSNFYDTSIYAPTVQPNFVLASSKLNNNSNLKFNSLTKIKFFNDKLYVLDSESSRFLVYNTQDLLINQGIGTSFETLYTILGFSTSNKYYTNKISTFCVNEKYFAFYNYFNNSISIFSSSFEHLYDLNQRGVTIDGNNNSDIFADLEFDTEGDLYLLTQQGNIFIYSVSDNNLTLKNKLYIKPNLIVFSSLSADSISDESEVLKKISFSKSDSNVLFVNTKNNVYKRFKSNANGIGQFNTYVSNTTYYSTLSSVVDPFNTLLVPPTGTAVIQKSPLDFYKYNINNVSSVKSGDYELVALSFIDNCTYKNFQKLSWVIGGLSSPLTFGTALTTFGMNPVSGSGITFFVDKPNYINLNNEELEKIKVYSFDEIAVKPGEFVTDFVVNKSLRKLLYNIFNYETYVTFKPVVNIDVNNNPIYERLDYIVSYDKDLDFTNFDNFVGINEITGTIFLNRCFTKIYNLLTTLKGNIDPLVDNVYPRFTDSVNLANNAQNFSVIFEDSKQTISGNYIEAVYPLNKSLCSPYPQPTPTSTPRPTSTNLPTPTIAATPTSSGISTVTPTPTPTPTVGATATPNVTAVVEKDIRHTVYVSLDNTIEIPAPIAPFSTTTKALSAVYKYKNTTQQSSVFALTATFDHTTFNQDLTSVNGDYTKLIGRKYGDYVLSFYSPAVRTNYTIGGKE